MRWMFLMVSASLLVSNSCGKAVTADLVQDNQLSNSQESGKYLFGSCSDAPSLTSCLKMRSLMLLEDLVQKDTTIHLIGNSLTLVKNAEERTGSRMLPTSITELDLSLPKDETSREETLDRLISIAAAKFIKSRVLQFRLPDLSLWSNWNTNVEEGRKKKGGMGAGWALMTAGGMMGALGLGSIALLAGKALMVSMMALMLSALAAMRKGGGGGGDHAATTYEVINVPTGHGHHGRSLSGYGLPRSLVAGVDLPVEHGSYMTGAELAYKAYLPKAADDNSTTTDVTTDH